MGWIGGKSKVTNNIKKNVIQELKKDLVGVEKKTRKNIDSYIEKTQAIDTSLLKNSISTERDVFNDGFRIRAKVLYKTYTSKNPTSATYNPSSKPPFAPPIVNSKPNNTVFVAILIMWGLGIHSKKGPRNFLGEGLVQTAKDIGLKDNYRVQ